MLKTVSWPSIAPGWNGGWPETVYRGPPPRIRFNWDMYHQSTVTNCPSHADPERLNVGPPPIFERFIVICMFAHYGVLIRPKGQRPGDRDCRNSAQEQKKQNGPKTSHRAISYSLRRTYGPVLSSSSSVDISIASAGAGQSPLQQQRPISSSGGRIHRPHPHSGQPGTVGRASSTPTKPRPSVAPPQHPQTRDRRSRLYRRPAGCIYFQYQRNSCTAQMTMASPSPP